MDLSLTVKPLLLYRELDDGQFMCKICGKVIKYQTNTIRHVHKHSENFGIPLSSFKYKGNNIFLATEKILLWKARYGISMNSIEDPIFKNFFQQGVIWSDKTNQEIMNSMCDQIIERNFAKTREKTIALIMDGGTILHTKWIAIGFMYKTINEIKYNILDCKIFEKKCTAKNIKDFISEISNKIERDYRGKIVAACTDNAANFVKVFLQNDDSENNNIENDDSGNNNIENDDLEIYNAEEEEEDGDFIPMNIIRLSCACHTIQLVLKDLYDNDIFYRNLTNTMKIIPARISRLKRSQIEELGIKSFPPLQSQRWNSIYVSLKYIIKNIDGISKLFSKNELDNLQFDELLQIKKELKPIYKFTTALEGDGINQSNVYIQYRALEATLEFINTDRSKLILQFVHDRFTSTADIDIAKLCYFTTNAGISEKQKNYPHVSLEYAITNEERIKVFNNETKFISNFDQTIKMICEILKIDNNIILECFETFMNHYTPKNDDINDYPHLNDLRNFFLEMAGDELKAVFFSRFIDILQIFPASEASAERIFAKMRDIYNQKQTRLTPSSLRTNLILAVYQEQQRMLEE